jgi:hypothetical protein
VLGAISLFSNRPHLPFAFGLGVGPRTFVFTCCILQGQPQLVTAAAAFTRLHLSSSTPLISLVGWFLGASKPGIPSLLISGGGEVDSVVVGFVTSSAGRVAIHFSGRLAGSCLGWGEGTLG